MLARLPHGRHTSILTSFGMRERSSETVGKLLAGMVSDHLASPAPVEEHLADQLMLPMALIAGGSYRCSTISRHSTTNAAVIDAFLPGAVAIEKEDDRTHRVTVSTP